MAAPVASETRCRLRLRVSGAVQGVGMRPFLYRAARELGLAGWMRNDTRGVTLELEGPEAALRSFVSRLRASPPPRAVISELADEWLDPVGLVGLEILPSDASGERVATVLPDLATCPACLEDIGVGGAAARAPGSNATGRSGRLSGGPDRRAGYPFTNCTDCGPRFSIIRALPYDRPSTTMAGFGLCPECRAEYEDPLDRRFHAQPTACPACGPHLYRLAAVPPEEGDPGPTSAADTGDRELIGEAARAIEAGRVVAVKGLGGFHLVVDARNEEAVARLRARKRRPVKPLAVMVRDLAMARSIVEVPDHAEAVLRSPEAPIVLLRRRPDGAVVGGVAPGNPYLGVMLPYTPLHHLLMQRLDGPVVATSGNLSDEPICIDEDEAAVRLAGIADGFLVHDRPIERPVDDSVVQWLRGAPRPIRRSRGYAPLPVSLPTGLPPVLAVGGHLKNTIGLARGKDVFLSQHIGDLETPQARDVFEGVIADFLRLYEVEPELVVHDAHPDYASTVWALGPGVDLVPDAERLAVQHHHAHLAACLADGAVDGPALGVIWDGTGLGPDGTVWGGEFLLGDASGYRRVAHFRRFRLPGGDAAVKEPRRMALALAHAAWGDDGVDRVLDLAGAGPSPAPGSGAWGWTEGEIRVLRRVLASGFRAPWTTSAGRLFDGVAALVGLRGTVGFEGEAAMALEYAADATEDGRYEVAMRGSVTDDAAPLELDWAPALAALLDDRDRGVGVGTMAARFHNGLADAIVEVAERVGMERVALSGGCFQNVVLTERTAEALERRGLRPVLHRRVPANDGGLALGQVAVAAARANT